MKKNKYSKYLLLVLVLIIWAGVAWQFMAVKNRVSFSNQVLSKNLPLDVSNGKRDTFAYTLKANYRDPFFSDFQNKMPAKAKVKVNIPKASSLKPSLPFPNIQYKGYLFSEAKRKVILIINQTTKAFPINQETQGIRISNVSKNSVKIHWKGQSKIIQRSY